MRRRGMTLIEVLGGLALLAVVLAGELVVKARYARQARLVAQRQAAIRAADDLLSAWWQTPIAFPRSAAGRVETAPDLQWQTRLLPNSSVEQLGGQVVRLEIRPATAATGQEPLIAVEVVLPFQGARR